MYALNLAEDNRILSACRVLPNAKYDDMQIVDYLPQDVQKGKRSITAYLYINEYIYDPLPEPEQPEPTPTQLDIIEAQVTYTAMMTDTLLEG